MEDKLSQSEGEFPLRCKPDPNDPDQYICRKEQTASTGTKTSESVEPVHADVAGQDNSECPTCGTLEVMTRQNGQKIVMRKTINGQGKEIYEVVAIKLSRGSKFVPRQVNEDHKEQE